jgi:hypothetical protein
MRKLSGLVMVGAVVVPLSLAQAATEVVRFPANNTFANVVSNDPVTGTATGVFVTRAKGSAGGPVDSIFFIISRPDGTNTFGAGTLPQGAFQVSGHTASLEVDINAITLDFQEGEIPENGLITADWLATDVQRISGAAKFEFDNVMALFVGTGADVASDAAGEVFGVPMVDPVGSLRLLHQGLIIVTKQ